MQHDGRFLNGLTLEDVSVSTQAEKGTLRVWEEAAGPRPLPETLEGGGCVCVWGVPEVEGRCRELSGASPPPAAALCYASRANLGRLCLKKTFST